VLNVAQSACSSLVPERWADGVESASFPASAELSADAATAWRLFGIRQTGALDEANLRTRDALTIVANCEKRDREAVEKLTRPWWRFWG
jgi:hypothetical protein